MENEILIQILDELKSVNGRLNNLEQGQAKLEAEVAEVKNTVEEASHRIVLMEQTNKLEHGALFDQGVVLDRRTKDIKASVDKIQDKQDLSFPKMHRVVCNKPIW